MHRSVGFDKLCHQKMVEVPPILEPDHQIARFAPNRGDAALATTTTRALREQLEEEEFSEESDISAEAE